MLNDLPVSSPIYLLLIGEFPRLISVSPKSTSTGLLIFSKVDSILPISISCRVY